MDDRDSEALGDNPEESETSPVLSHGPSLRVSFAVGVNSSLFENDTESLKNTE
jgi:hypothetical protein